MRALIVKILGFFIIIFAVIVITLPFIIYFSWDTIKPYISILIASIMIIVHIGGAINTKKLDTTPFVKKFTYIILLLSAYLNYKIFSWLFL